MPLICNTLASGLRLASAGQGRILATSGRVRSRLLPGVPTLIEQGMRDLAVSAWYAVFAPARTPPDTLGQVLGQLTTAALSPVFRAALEASGLDLLAEGPVALARTVVDDRAHWATILSRLNLPG